MSEPERRPPARSALVWGVLFVMVGVVYLLQALGVWEVRGQVLLPVLLIVAGVTVIVTGVMGGRPSTEVGE